MILTTALCMDFPTRAGVNIIAFAGEGFAGKIMDYPIKLGRKINVGLVICTLVYNCIPYQKHCSKPVKNIFGQFYI